MDAVVVYKKDNKWFIGKITNDKLRKKKQIKKLADATADAEYITFKQWLKKNKDKSTVPEEYLAKLKINSLYVLNDNIVDKTRAKTVDISNTQSKKTKIVVAPTEKEWWSKFNDLCISCAKKCKQSSFVEIIACKREQI